MCKQLEDERKHVAISLGQMNKGCSACGCARARGDQEQEAGLSQI